MAILTRVIGAAAAAGALLLAAGTWLYWPTFQAERHVRAHLRDPDSAQFDELRVDRASGAACGFVNARNAMGGYVGWTAFILTPEGDVTLLEDGYTNSQDSADQIIAKQALNAFKEKAQRVCPPK